MCAIRICAIGIPLTGAGVETHSLQSHASFRDFDVLVIDAGAMVSATLSTKAQKSSLGPFLKLSDKNELVGVLERREQDVNEYLKLGRVAVVVANAAPSVQWESLGGSLKGQVPFEFPALGISHTFRKANGRSFEVVMSGPEGTFLKEIAQLLEYRAIFENAVGTSAVEAPGSATVGCVAKPKGGGTLILTPSINFRSGRPQDCWQLYGAIRNLLTALAPGTGTTLPDWTTKLLVPGERVMLERENDLRQELAMRQEELQRTIDNREAVQARKALFSIKGQPLVDAVRGALTRIGFAVEPGPEKRDDLIARHPGGRVLVVEAKGRDNRGAKESDSAQLEKWVSGFYEREGREPKGLLVINGYIESELYSRTEDVFPNQMLEYASRKQQCLISGVQLFCLSEHAQLNVDAANAAADLLFTTVGVLPQYRAAPDWGPYVEQLVGD